MYKAFIYKEKTKRANKLDDDTEESVYIRSTGGVGRVLTFGTATVRT